MTTTTRTTALPLADLLAVFAGAAANRVVYVFRALKNRHEAGLLANFDDRMLADIGLSRSDIRDAYSMPIWTDPTALLKNRAGERQRYRRNAPFGLAELHVSAPPLAPDMRCVPADLSVR